MAVYIPFQADLKPEQIWEILGPWWSDQSIAKIGPDLKMPGFGENVGANHWPASPVIFYWHLI